MNKTFNLKRAIVSVINDLVTDRRVHKTCIALLKQGFEVSLVGRKMRKSPELPDREYKMHRMYLIFEKGPFFYAEYNIRLFFYLLFRSSDLYFSNDLDTLMPNFLIGRLKRKPIIYDSHEYFTETPEVVNRKLVKKIWKMIEKTFMPGTDETITVNESIAGLFNKDYGINPVVIRNIPPSVHSKSKKNRKDLGLPKKEKIAVLQGAGINIQRGAEELVEGMQYTNDILLLIIGGGDVIDKLKKMVKELQLEKTVRFIPKVPFETLYQYTVNADIGITIDKNTNINYLYSLPNKLFDYIHAGIPILASRLPEIEKIIKQYEIGAFIESHEPEHIASCLNNALKQQDVLDRWKENLKFAKEQLNWEAEESKLINVLQKYA